MNIPQVTIDLEEDGTLLLAQEWCGESDRIQLHPIHVRYLAELLGFLEPMTLCRIEKQSEEIK